MRKACDCYMQAWLPGYKRKYRSYLFSNFFNFVFI